MKKTLQVAAFLLLSNVSLFASHFMGGEITWECMPNGNYRFIVHVYRECQGCSTCFSVSDTLKTNVPGLNNIYISLYPNATAGKVDISPACNPDTSFNHISCFPAPSIANTGSIEEYTYTTDATYPNGVNLPGGTIPPGGWYFAFTNCCRNPSTNYSNSNNKYFWLRTVMYPYPTINQDICFDNSPTFGEKPVTVVCTGYPFVYNPAVIDKDFDSLVFGWTGPLENPTTWLTGLNPFYNYYSPLPGIALNAANVPASVNPQSGEISFTSHTSGSFITCYSVRAYKCGVRVAEVFREHQIVLTNCPQPTNTPPAVQAPFLNPTTGLYTNFTDTLFAGSAFDFDISSSDFQTQSDGLTLQNISFSAWGQQFGSNFTNDSAGCLHPPCATLSPMPPATDTSSLNIHFHWQTDSIHLLPNNACEQASFYKNYDFVFKFSNDFCPIPARIYKRIRLVVKDPQIPPESAGMINGPHTVCPHGGSYIFSVPPISDATQYHWSLPPGVTGSSDSNRIVVLTNNTLGGSISVYGSNPYGTGASTSITLIVAPQLTPMQDQTIIPGSFTILTSQPSPSGTSYSYHWSNGMTDAVIAVSPVMTTDYIVTITNGGGCWQTDTVKVNVSGSGNVNLYALGSDTACAGQLRLPVYFSSFQDVDSLSLSFSYPGNILNYLGIDSIHPMFNNANLSVSAQNNKILIRWNAANAVSFANVIKVLQLKFQYHSGYAGLQWDVTQPGACSIYNSQNQACPMGYADGTVINGVCASLNGTLNYDNTMQTPMMNVKIQAWKEGVFILETTTDNTGSFLFTNLPKGLLTLRPQCNKAWSGVNAADALAILKHTAGLNILTGFHAQSADVNLSNAINSLDALLTARRFTAMIHSFPVNDWIYQNNTVLITDDSNYSIAPKALCAGDVNGSYIP